MGLDSIAFCGDAVSEPPTPTIRDPLSPNLSSLRSDYEEAESAATLVEGPVMAAGTPAV